jgi:hypothetical protein
MSAVFEDDEARAQGGGCRLRRCQRNRILSAVDDDGRDVQLGQCGQQVEVAEGRPDALLDAPDDAKRREVAGACGVGEVAGDAELEAALSVRVGIGFAKTRGAELGAKPLNDFTLLAACELGLELRAMRAADGGGVNKREGTGNRERGTGLRSASSD